MTIDSEKDRVNDRIENNTHEKDEYDYPKVRPVEAHQVSAGEQILFIIRDPLELKENLMIVSPQALFIMSLLDGKHSITQVQTAYNRKFGQLIFSDKIRDLIFELDANLLLDNHNFRSYMEFLKMEFEEQKEREPSHAGKSYAEEPDQLKKELEEYLKEAEDVAIPPIPPLGVIAPHIDFARGGRTYGVSYNALKKSSADTFFIFGTSHHKAENFIALTRKTFKTPLGNIPVDTHFVDLLVQGCKTDFFQDEFLHRDEHSIEFQVIFLKHIFPERELKIIPILVSSFDEEASKGKKPEELPPVKEFSDNFKRAFGQQQGEKKFGFIAGIDLAHVGLGFGDAVPPDLRRLKNLEEDEIKSLGYIERMDLEGFFKDVAPCQDKRRVCGFSPLYLMLKVMPAKEGKLLEYRQSVDPQGYHDVSYASMAFYPW